MPSIKSRKMPAHSWQFKALGTTWEISSARAIADVLKRQIDDEIEQFDATYSRFRPDSLVSKAARSPGTYTFPRSATSLFDFYDELYVLSSGKVNPLVGGALEVAGYDADYSLRPRSTPNAAPDYRAAMNRKGVSISLREETLVDIGAIGKGYLVDHVSDLLRAAGHEDFVVDGSGDMRIEGGVIESVGLENPLNTEQVIGVVKVQNGALCASAVNRRAWGEWHHVLDATTGMPTRDIIATWVLADSAMIADGLATALFFVAPNELATRYTYEYMRMYADGSIDCSDYFSKGVF